MKTTFPRALHDGLTYNSQGDLTMDGIDYQAILAEANRTSGPSALTLEDPTQTATSPGPVYAYSLEKVTTQYNKVFEAYHTALGGDEKKSSTAFSLHYSMKANSTLGIIKHLVGLGAGIDCVSGGEVYRALHAGCSGGKHIVFAGVGKTRADIQYAVGVGVTWFDVENVLEVDHIAEAATKYKKTDVNIALRCNPDVQADTFKQIATGHGGAKFGLPLAEVKKVLETKPAEHPHLNFTGIHLHIGSQLGSVDSTVKAIQEVKTYLKDFMPPERGEEGEAIEEDGDEKEGRLISHAKKKRVVITHINVGGGLPANYGTHPEGTELPTADLFAQAVCPLVQCFDHVMLEPGRSIIGEAGVLLTEVLYRKDQDGQRMLIVDASMCDLMRPALYNAHHPIGPAHLDLSGVSGEDISLQTKMSGWTTFTICGPVCESTDVLATDIPLPESATQPGAVLAILTAGAYGASMASNYNSRPFIPEVATVRKEGGEGQPLGSVATSDGDFELKTLRKRQNWSALVADEEV